MAVNPSAASLERSPLTKRPLRLRRPRTVLVVHPRLPKLLQLRHQQPVTQQRPPRRRRPRALLRPWRLLPLKHLPPKHLPPKHLLPKHLLPKHLLPRRLPRPQLPRVKQLPLHHQLRLSSAHKYCFSSRDLVVGSVADFQFGCVDEQTLLSLRYSSRADFSIHQIYTVPMHSSSIICFQ